MIKLLTKKDYGISGDKFGARPAWGGMAVDAGPGQNYHIGVDYGTPSGTKLYAPADGRFLKTVRDGVGDGYGNYILFYVPDSDVTIHLAHLNHIEWLENKEIKKGTYIGNTGNTGISSGPHLHLGIASGKKTDTVKGNLGDGTWLDPSKFDFNDTVKVQPSFDEVVQGVIDGKYGNGQARVNAVNATGHDYDKVQEKVNERLAGAKPKPSKPSFSPYNYSLAKGSTLYDSKGNAYAYPTTQAHTVKVLKENNGLGLIREPWLVGVSEAWIKLGAKPQAQPKPKPSLVGKQVTLSGKTRLFHNSTGSTTYPYNSVNQYTDLRARNVPVVQDKGDRVEVRISGFDPELIWIDKKNYVKTGEDK